MILQDAVNVAINYLGDKYFEKLNITYINNQTSNELTIKKDGNDVLIRYGKLVSLFLGLSIVKKNYKKDKFEKHLFSHFNHNGLMHDCSRNGAVNISKCKELILCHALFGLNRFMLYTEDVYEIKDEPYFGYFRGRYTKEEIKELCEYASSFGVDIIPCIQTLSHLNQALRWTSQYGDIRSSEQTLKIGEEKTYLLIDKMIKTVKENFSSEYVHIGMDEAIDIGLYDFLLKDKFVNKKELLLQHLNRVIEIVNKYSLKPMMWADMFFKIDPKAKPDWYDFEGMLEDDVKNKIPNNVNLIYWDYYHNDIETYDKMMKICLDTKREVTFASGFIRWIGYVPNFNMSFKKCSSGLKAAINNHIQDVLATTWGDGGGEGIVISSLPFLALHSTFDYNGEYDEEKINDLLLAVTNLSLDDWFKMSLPNEVSGKELLPFENPSKPFLYNDPLLGLFDLRAFDEFEDIYKNHTKTLNKISKKAGRYAYAYNTLKDLCDLLSIKVTIGKKCRQNYKDHNLDELANRIKDLKIIDRKLDKFIKTYKTQWLIENKAFGLEVHDGRLGFLKARIKTAIEVINDYLNGEIDKIQEFEEEVLPYNGSPNDEAHCYNYWEEIASCNIIK